MASTFSQTLRLELIGDGDQSGTWGQTTNTNLGTLLEQAITGVVNITMVDANYTLTNFNGVSDEARNAVLVVGGTNAAVRDIIAPLVEKLYVVKNSTVGGFGIRIIGATGTGVTVPSGATVWVYCDGTNFNAINTESVGNFEVNGNLTVTGDTNAVAATYTGNVVALNYSTAGNVTATGNVSAASFSGAGLTITSINASNISAGTIANARTTAASANGASTIVARDADGSFAANVGTFVAVSGAHSGNGAGLTDINASNISSGTIANARTTAASANGASTIVARDADGSFSANVVSATVGSFTNVTYTGTLTGGSINNTPIGASTANTGAFTTLSASGNVSLDGGTFVFNDAGADKDARFEGDTDANLLFLDASTNRIGIGVNPPLSRLDISTTDKTEPVLKTTGSVVRIFLDNGTVPASYDDGEQISFNNSDSAYTADKRVLSFGASPATATSGSSLEASSGYVRSVGNLSFVTTSFERARITTNGEFYIAGFTSQGAYNLQVAGTGVWGAGAYVNGSDERIKDDIAPLDSGLDVVTKLNPVTYKYKEDWSKDQSTQTGFIAQELLTALDGKNYADGVVQQGGEYMSVAYQNIIPILTKAIQEQQTIINDLKARIETLENKK